jgi:hypothetical protein
MLEPVGFGEVPVVALVAGFERGQKDERDKRDGENSVEPAAET